MNPRELSTAEPDDPLLGSKYRCLAVLGRGGMGIAYDAEHREVGTRVVVKVLRREVAATARVLDRVRLEAQVLARLSHPNIVSVLDLGQLRDGRPFLVMERLRGRTLAGELRERRLLPIGEAVHYEMELLRALSAAHALGVVHRDIKPDNLFLHREAPGGRPLLKVLDFGIARVLPDAPPHAPAPLSVPTETGSVIGTPRYASPEAARGQRVDGRADVYAAALVLYVMLSGRGPFDHARDERGLLAAHSGETPHPPSSYAREPIPAELDRLVMKALAKDPAERFASAEELLDALERVARLLAHPAGWLETTAFDRSSLAAPTTPAVSVSAAPPSTRTRTRAADSPVTLGVRPRVLPLVFLGAAAFFALLAWTTMSLLRGAR